ncbi:MAG: hypothetical protein IKV45_05375 [Firmicutes bacterium]|nr:hypothetical protein [Bacillota bacterium]
MSLYTTPMRPFIENGLIEELFFIKNKCMICIVAGCKLVLISDNADTIREVGGPFCMVVDQGFLEGLLAPAERTAAYHTDRSRFDEVILFNEDTLTELKALKAQVDAGEVVPDFDREFVKKYKKKYIEQHQKLLRKFGEPPQFSSKKALTFGLLAFWFTDMGVPFFYIGRPLLGVLSIVVSVFSCATMFFPPMFLLAAFGVVVFPIMATTGSVKDRQGRRIAPQKTQQTVKQVWRNVVKYRRDLNL